ncbi:MAG: hypothetical protein ACTSV3_06125 [Candidatus Thorarchaeota archaeon]
MRQKPVVCVIVSLLVCQVIAIGDVRAIDTIHGGLIGLDELITGNFTIWVSGGQLNPDDLDYIDQMAAAGVRVNHATGWWSDYVSNPLDIIYNDTVRQWMEESIMWGLNLGPPPSYDDTGTPPPEKLVNTSSLWAVTLGDEEPAWIRHVDIYSEVAPEIAKYDDLYYQDTGMHLRPLYETNQTECRTQIEWLSNKTVWVYNYAYDYVKSLVPHALITQFLMMPPTWGLTGDLCPVYEVKSDLLTMDCYYARDDPWLLYETIRRYRASLPDKPFFITIWGTIWDFLNEAGDGLYYKEGSIEQIRRETWASYVSGVDGLGFFDWAPDNNNSYTWSWGHTRTDTFGRTLFAYIDNLAGQLNMLPTLNSTPEVLVIGDGYQTSEAMTHVDHLRLFTEYDLINQRCFAKTDVNLSKYSLVLVTDRWHYNDTVQKLNQYVADGGNVIFLGGIQDELSPDSPRARYDVESGITEFMLNEHVLLNITEPNILGLNMTVDAPFHVGWFLNGSQLTTHHHPIGNTYLFYGNGTPYQTNHSSLLLYHDSSAPGSGWLLYAGALHLSTDSDTTSETYDYDNEPELRAYCRDLVRAFARFLNITNSISTSDTENMLITQGPIDDKTLMVGICNFNNESRTFDYSVDLGKYSFPDGVYYVHSLDANSSLGSFEFQDGVLTFSVDVVTNGTRLLLVSEEPPNPDYAIDIFPPIPHLEETSTNTSTTTTTPTVDAGFWLIVPLTAAGGMMCAVLIIYAIRRRSSNTTQ